MRGWLFLVKNEAGLIPDDFIQDRKTISQDLLYKDPEKFTAIGLDGKFKEKKEFEDFDLALFWVSKRKQVSTIGLSASLLLSFILLNETRLLEKIFELILSALNSVFGLVLGLVI